MKWLGTACVACSCLVGASTYLALRVGVDVAVPQVSAPAVAAAPTKGAEEPHAEGPDAARARIEAARRDSPTALDGLIAEQRGAALSAPGDAAPMRILAEALLERIGLVNRPRGLRVGEPLYDELPPAIARDVDEGLDLLQRARKAGDDSAENWRLEASLLANRVTSLGSALQWNGRIERALAHAAARDPDDPALHVTLGLRKLLAPRFLGHDPAGALEHFAYAAHAPQLRTDERPRVFAAMAAFLLARRQAAMDWLEQAVAINPDNAFARTVLARVRRGEDDPFGRDVAPAAASAPAVAPSASEAVGAPGAPTAK